LWQAGITTRRTSRVVASNKVKKGQESRRRLISESLSRSLKVQTFSVEWGDDDSAKKNCKREKDSFLKSQKTKEGRQSEDINAVRQFSVNHRDGVLSRKEWEKKGLNKKVILFGRRIRQRYIIPGRRY